MGRGAKIAVGCAVAFVVVSGIAVVAALWAAYWVKGKVKEVAGDVTAKAQEIEKYQSQANANPFVLPADGVVQEDRLLKFLEVRRQMYAVYQLHRAAIEAAGERGEASLSDIAKFGSLLADLQLEKSRALARVGMNDSEYLFHQTAVYQSSWASTMQRETGKQLGESLADAAEQGRRSLREGLEEAARAGYPAGGQVSDQEIAGAEEALEELGGKAGALDVPQANIDLFREHEAEIRRYAMTGLSFVGF